MAPHDDLSKYSRASDELRRSTNKADEDDRKEEEAAEEELLLMAPPNMPDLNPPKIWLRHEDGVTLTAVISDNVAAMHMLEERACQINQR